MHFRYCDVRTWQNTHFPPIMIVCIDSISMRTCARVVVRRFHTSMPNTSSLPREAIITSYSDKASGFGDSEIVDGWEREGLLYDLATRRMLGRV